MSEPSLRKSRLALAGGLATILLIGGGGFLVGRTTSARDPEPIAAVPAISSTLAYTPPPEQTNQPKQIMARSDLIALASRAADAVAAGRRIPAAVTGAEGRRFEIRIPFGCQGPADETSDAAMRWHYDPEAQALRVHVAPVVFDPRDIFPGAPPEEVAAIKGFWITRPWTSSETCPPENGPITPSGTEPVTLPGQTLALIEFFAEDGLQQARRGNKPYETVVRTPPETFSGKQGLQLRVKGRIANIPDRGPVSCRQPAGTEQRPICVISIATDEIAIENPASRDVLATWTIDGRGSTTS